MPQSGISGECGTAWRRPSAAWRGPRGTSACLGEVRRIAKPFFPWVGGKLFLLPYIFQLLPRRAPRLLEVCGGSGAVTLGLPEEEVRRRVEQAMERTGVTALRDKPTHALSYGQKKRVAIAGVLVMEPSVVILDEPTAGLDPKGRDEILDEILELHDKKGMTIILVSHSMEDIARYADRLMVMNQGEKVYDGAPKEVFEHYRELEAIGLAAPQITYIVHELKDHGVPIDEDITTVEEAKAAILSLLGK